MSDKSVWLIERKYNSVTHYFRAPGYPVSTSDSRAYFDPNPNVAIQFARKQDAEMYIHCFLSDLGSAHEHIWMEPKP